jgi:hypothetical protein
MLLSRQRSDRTKQGGDDEKAEDVDDLEKARSWLQEISPPVEAFASQ